MVNSASSKSPTVNQDMEEEFGSWMVVGRRQRRLNPNNENRCLGKARGMSARIIFSQEVTHSVHSGLSEKTGITEFKPIQRKTKIEQGKNRITPESARGKMLTGGFQTAKDL